MKYRPFHPVSHGKKVWAYYYREGGKRRTVQEHPETGRPFRSRAEVDRWIEKLRGRAVKGTGTTVGELGKYMFSAGGPWAQRRARRRDGRPLAEHTLQEHEINYRLHIEPAIGKEALAAVDTQMIDAMLYDNDLSNRARRNVAATLVAILTEAVYRRIITSLPIIELPEKKSRKPSVLTLEELRRLFPRDRQGLQEVWGGEKTRPEPAACSLAMAACAAVMFFGGLRPQEARAAGPDQFLKKLSVLLVTRSMDSQGRVNEYLKRGDERDPRYRGTLLIDRAMEVLEVWLLERKRSSFLFTCFDKPIRGELLRSRLKAAAARAGIPVAGRRIIPYSGRFTYNTTVRPFLPPEVMLLLMGHTSATMTDHYDLPVLKERMAQLAPYREKINQAIG